MTLEHKLFIAVCFSRRRKKWLSSIVALATLKTIFKKNRKNVAKAFLIFAFTYPLAEANGNGLTKRH